MTVTRRQAREWVIQMLTAADLNPSPKAEDVIANFWDQLRSLEKTDGGTEGKIPRGKVKAFAEERVLGVLGHLAELDALLAAHLTGEWDFARLGTVERAVLRLGAWELKNTDIPKAVVINEAVDLANWFSTPRSRTFVNGVLGNLI